ncbi:MAG: DNA repair protein RadC [Spirochaetia bacterium]|nr:DNA repair protein RadC [Spirochaetia bacterium]
MKQYKQQPSTNINIKELPVSERPRERLESLGALSLSDIELITIMIGSGTTKNPAMQLASEILHVLDSHPVDEQLEVKHLVGILGLGMAKATLICAALELGRRRLPSRRKQIIFPGDVFPLIQHIGNRLQEHFLCISLNGAHEVMSITTVSIGLVNHTLVHPREVFSTPLRERATAIIVAHNHPSKMLLPSGDDRNVTKRLRDAGDLLGIKVLDHLIFSDESYRSMLENDEWN